VRSLFSTEYTSLVYNWLDLINVSDYAISAFNQNDEARKEFFSFVKFRVEYSALVINTRHNHAGIHCKVRWAEPRGKRNRCFACHQKQKYLLYFLHQAGLVKRYTMCLSCLQQRRFDTLLLWVYRAFLATRSSNKYLKNVFDGTCAELKW